MMEETPDGKPVYGRELALARTKLQEAKMWLGKCLGALGVKPSWPEDNVEGTDQSCHDVYYQLT